MKKEILVRAREVFDTEVAGVNTVRDNLGESFVQLVNRCMKTISAGGKLVLTGVGKSGYIGKKIAATLSSVGSPAVFMHPVEARHGDLGIMQKNDLLIALSYSGETEELLAVLTPAKRLGVELVSITASRGSSLGRMSDLVVEMPVPKEACPFNLAPTTTTTALLVLGDALAMVLLDEQGFTKSDYGRLHPGGAIGRMVTLRAEDIMRGRDRSAIVGKEATVRDAIIRMSAARCGSAIIEDAEHKLLGIFTDGDLRRWAEKDLSVLERRMSEVMTPNPVAVRAEQLAVEVLKVLESRHIDDIVVTDESGCVAGFIDVQDLPGLKLM
ncbi:KpsF/GutQ family sugar-phosphate isomerase [uncultured Victivallis sp.]|uniref:KpsF/GutQ family sugar-phosphate isomerase n=1 Tax=uncultured Victivallis sp. TaxID=354118 RepID=UPI0025FB1E23|nr:KpsF/GutQ family sugar-phosphate isomerase [uncultured Victivallis sp.]